ncbi:MAG: bifunctional folylpolyglutamate synthase/dihydrofolate synthase [Chloroflexi bacterium]|nr:bifunctional folylpolyglutamate synthase/dihydrofolate synthase [Chloroflexota bacterium]
MAEINGVGFQTAVDYVLSFADYERLSRSAVVFDIARIEALLKRIGNPHLAAKSVHVAGTKGKGSTAAMIASVLTASGYRTGLYTSPHLLTIRERIQVDGRLISEGEFAAVVERLKPEIEHVNRFGELGELTTFEILTAIAFAYFKERAVDFQVLETGLGGRLDATNVVKPEVCVITSISLDHTEVLGDTIAKIAAEKAGIIKPGCKVVCAPQKAEALAVIEKACQDRGASLVKIGEKITWRRTRITDSSQSFRLKGTRGEYDLTIPLLGEHQLENAAAAVAALEILRDRAPGLSDGSIAAGLARVNWPGRLQVLQRNPLFIVDGAHNADSARRLREALKQYFDFDDAILIVGTSQEKDIPGIVAELSSLTSQVIVTRSAHPRAATAARLVAEFSKWEVNPEVTEDIASAVGLALAKAKPRDLICVTGSLFVVSEAIEHLKTSGSEQ